MSDDIYQDRRKNEFGDFAYGPGESPDYVEYVPEALGLLDIYLETAPGSQDAIRILKLAKSKFWKEPSNEDLLSQ